MNRLVNPLLQSEMCVAPDITKAGLEIVVSLFLLLCLNFNNHPCVEAQNTSGIMRKTCYLKPQVGPCRGNILMYYFDPKSGHCKKFTWGGCQGNGNRFDSREECYSSCYGNSSSAKVRPRYCSLNFDYGYCFGALPRYYYDHLWKVCKERLYSGCGGNKNNFYSIEQCDSICRFGNGYVKSATARIKKDQFKKVLIINPEGVNRQVTKTPGSLV